MVKDKFQHVLQDDEEIIWSNGVNKKAYILNTSSFGIFSSFAFGIILSAFLGIIPNTIKGNDEVSYWLPAVLSYFAIIFVIGLTLSLIGSSLNARNTFFAITNKRIIKRSGKFSDRFEHYSLQNVGNVEVRGTIFDSKGENGSANLIVLAKSYHTNTAGASTRTGLMICSLNNAYEAYNVLSEKVHGNNESFKLKIEQ